MRMLKSKKTTNRNHQLLILAGMIAKLHSMERECISMPIKSHIDKVRNSIQKLQNAIFRGKDEDWLKLHY